MSGGRVRRCPGGPVARAAAHVSLARCAGPRRMFLFARCADMLRARVSVIAACAALLVSPWTGLFPAPPGAFVAPATPPWTAADGPPPLIVDTHADTTQRIVYQGASFLDGIPGAHLDLPKMRAGGLSAEFFSIFVLPSRTAAAAYFSEAMKQIPALQALAAGTGGRLALARPARDVRDAAGRGVPAALLGVEGGHALGP